MMINNSDDYQWLEDLDNKDVIDWIKNKTITADEYINRIPCKDRIKKIVESFCDQARYEIGISNVCVHGRKLFYIKSRGLSANSGLYMRDIDSDTETLLIDPSKISDTKSGFIYLANISHDCKYIGVILCKDGSDACELRVYNLHEGRLLNDIIECIKISTIEFYGDGFYYSNFDNPSSIGASLINNIPKNHKLYYHQLGNKQNEDILIIDKNYFIDQSEQLFNDASVFWSTILEDRYLIVRCVNTSYVYWLYKDLSVSDGKFTKIMDASVQDGFVIVGSIDGRLYYLSFKDANNGHLISVDLKENPFKFRVVVAEREQTIKKATIDCGKIFISYMEDVKTTIIAYDMYGKYEYEIKMPFICSARTSSGPKINKFTAMEVESFISPKTIYIITAATGEIRPLSNGTNVIDPNNYEIKQVFYTSFDNKKVPMFIIGKKNRLQDKQRLLVLTGYGAGKVSVTPYYSYFALSLIECGGVYAVANIRGGGEYGQEWYLSGIRNNRINSFRDFICGAEYLIAEGYTSKELLATYGGSNGGTMVAACMNMRPDLFRVVISNSGLHDMLRFHKIGFGSSWVSEYGNPDNKLDEQYLKQYSPILNIRSNIRYPAVMVPVCENDDRVSPTHSYKLIEALNDNKAQGGPFILRLQKNAGHQLRPLTSQIDEFSDVLCFILKQTNCLNNI